MKTKRWKFGLHVVFGMWLLCSNRPLLATNYYLSNAGNDANTGITISSPWASIDKLNAVVFQPGDSILFSSGNVFSGQLTINANGTALQPLVIATYGGSDPAIISGAQPVSGWTIYTGSIYKATFSVTPSQFFINQQPLLLARFPNSGYYHHQQGAGNYAFIDSALTQPDHYWDGAGIRMRSADRRYEYNTVSKFENDTVYFTNAAMLDVTPGMGYYLDNIFTELDTAGEWYYDSSTSTIYCYSFSGTDPQQQITETGIYDYGILFQNGGSNCIIENLQFEKQNKDALHCSDAVTNLAIRFCRFLLQGETGINLPGGASIATISNNTFQKIKGAAIIANQLIDASVFQNTIRLIGLIPGYGINNLQQGYGISLDNGVSVVISENIIDSTGNSAINLTGLHLVAEKNYCSYNVLHFNNQGGIYSYGYNADSVTIRSNIILHTEGSTEASINQEINTCGIFLDEETNHYFIISNSIAFATSFGITIYRGGTNHVISGNLVYGCGMGQLNFTEGSIDGSNASHLVTNNRLYAIHENSAIVNLNSDFENFIPAAFDSNYYFNPYDFFAYTNILNTSSGKEIQQFTLSQWQALHGGDAESKATFFFRNRYASTSISGSELIGNGTFTNNTDNWVNDTPDNLMVLLDNSTPLDNGCMKLVTTTGGPFNYGETYHSGIQADSGSFYQFDFSCYSLRDGNTAFFQKEVVPPFGILDLGRYFPFSNLRNDYSIIYQHNRNISDTRLVARISVPDSLAWLDNISLQEVQAVYEDPLKKSRLFINNQSQPVSFNLLDSVFYDLDQQIVSGAVILPPFSSTVLIFDSALITNIAQPEISLNAKPSLFIYPSLTTALNGVNIRLLHKGGKSGHLTIINSQGKMILRHAVQQPFDMMHLDLPSGLLPGIYILMFDDKLIHLQGKFIIQ